MSDLHAIGAFTSKQNNLEAVSPQFLQEGLLNARKLSWNIFSEVRKELKTGMTEQEAHKLALKVFENEGVQKHWHRPYIRFGPGTVLTFNHSLQANYRLKENDPVYFDFGPVWADKISGLEYEGDIGDTFVFGVNAEAEKVINSVHILFNEALTQWLEENASGEKIYSFLKNRASSLGYSLIEKVEGHRLADYPHVKYSKEQLSKIPFTPSNTLWILEIQIKHPLLPLGAFYEDLLYRDNPGAGVTNRSIVA